MYSSASMAACVKELFFHQAARDAATVKANEMTSVTISLSMGSGLLPHIARALFTIARIRHTVLMIVPFEIFIESFLSYPTYCTNSLDVDDSVFVVPLAPVLFLANRYIMSPAVTFIVTGWIEWYATVASFFSYT